MNTWGNNIKLTVFGESHGPGIGCVLDGIESGIIIDNDFIASEMARRAPGRDEFSTERNEADIPRIISGVKDGVTTGAPITCIIENTDRRSEDYDKLLRPGHADWTSLLKYGYAADFRGGGRFSGRLTAPLVFAGAICKLILRDKSIRIYGRISGIAGEFDGIDLAGEAANQNLAETEKMLADITANKFLALNEVKQNFKDLILAAKNDGDSVGGTIDVAVFGNTAGLGEPFFGSVESTLSSLYFSVPAVKAVEWGRGFYMSSMCGNEANDGLRLDKGGENASYEGNDRKNMENSSASNNDIDNELGLRNARKNMENNNPLSITSLTNNNGGVLGGIANGMPIFARVAIKPTASIAAEQNMIAYDTDSGLKEVRASVRGRHDPCIVPRAVPVIEAVTAIGLLDLLKT